MDNIERGEIEDLADEVDKAIEKAKEQLDYYFVH